MHPEIAALARRHDLSPALVAELDALWGSRDADPTMLLDDFEPVALADPEAPPAEAAGEALIGGRYADLGPLGAGGMGEVRRVRDVPLNRILAMKVLRQRLAAHEGARMRFLEETQATAQLQHPGIVPVHDLGVLPDGRLWFTMKEVRGRTLAEVIEDVHAASSTHWAPGQSGWTFRRLVAAFSQACHAVSYAHQRGVVHRDLKPDNVMVGSHGEVLVLDWGLAKVLGRQATVEVLDAPVGPHDLSLAEGTVVSGRSSATRAGALMGTPSYMPPEQAAGRMDAVDARSDVYALGAILFELLTGRPPYEGTLHEVVAAILDGGPPSVVQPHGRTLPPELVAACERAMAADPNDRFGSALDLATELQAWLDGARRREQALEVVAMAEATGPEAEQLRTRAAALEDEARALLATVPRLAPEDDKAPAWDLEEQATVLERRADLKTVEREQLLQGALTIAPELPEAHAALVAEYLERHAVAQIDRDPAAVSRTEVQIRHHAEALPVNHAVRRHALAYLAGDGALTLVTDPPDAEVRVHRVVAHRRRLVAESLPVQMHRTPVREVPLALGSYLCTLHHPDRVEVRYPVCIGRGEHWHGVRPGGHDPFPVVLPLPSALGPDDCYVPAGWFRAGDGRTMGSVPAGTRLWCDAFVLGRFPVNNRAYLAFLDDLVDRGEEDAALRWVPRERSGHADQLGSPLYGRGPDGHFRLEPDSDGDSWDPTWPVIMVDFDSAVAYAAWLAGRSGLPWRLPADFEWEKGARGVDARLHPWGDGVDATYACHRDSHEGRMLPKACGSHPVDCSPYGVMDMGGNVRDWCADHFSADGALPTDQIVVAHEATGPSATPGKRVVRGGHWYGNHTNLRSALRYSNEPVVRDTGLGFRVARTL